MTRYSREQWATLTVFSICQFFNAMCFSVQAPFYPSEAESKGATASQYGLVFGVYELVIFITCPIYGKYINKIGPKLVNNLGIFIVAVMCIAFGFLNYVDDANTFIALSFVIRIVEGMGCAAFITSAFTIIAKEFPGNIGFAFASLETLFGLGLICGPTIGGALYEVGGYTLPFGVLGCLLIAASVLIYCVLPSQIRDPKGSQSNSGQLLAALRLPSISLFAFTVCATSISIGFLQATLEPHLRLLSLMPFQTGLMFVLNGSTYAITAPLWGCLSDKVFNPRFVTVIGSLFIIIAFLLVGPVPFIPLETTLTLCIVALVLHGVGIGAGLVATFSGLHKDAITYGFPNDLSTYGMVSGIWNSSFALGCFIGPTIAGVLYDQIGFSWATLFVVGIHLLVVLIIISYSLCCRIKQYSTYISVKSVLSQTEEEQPVFDVCDRPSSYGSAGPSTHGCSHDQTKV